MARIWIRVGVRVRVRVREARDPGLAWAGRLAVHGWTRREEEGERGRGILGIIG